MAWPTTIDSLSELQARLAAEQPALWKPPSDRPPRVAGAFVCFPEGKIGAGAAGDRAWAAAALLEGRRLVESTELRGEARAPFQSGWLALREGPILAQVLARLHVQPDVVLVDATGRDHPRRAGLALQLGWELGLPSIGVTRRSLLAQGDPPGAARGDRTPLILGAETVGYWLRTRADARPVAVHAGWAVDAELAARVVLEVTVRSRTPEPIRQARQLARRARAAATLEQRKSADR